MIVAAAAPLGVAIGNLPVGLLLGNGIGLPAAFLAAALVIACMATGFMRLARDVRADGGFADLVRAGLGKSMGLVAAYITGISYWTGSLALAASTGYFGNLIGTMHGVDVPWWAYSLTAYAIVLLLGRRAADLSAKVLTLLMLAELAVVVFLDGAILVKHGLDALPLSVFSAHNAFSGNLGPAVLVGFSSFIGVESAVLYTRETRNPARSVPRATYAAVAAIGVLYVMTAWLVIGSLGTAAAVATAGQAQGGLVFLVAGTEVSTVFVNITQVFFVTSLMACFVALHNASARYTHTLAANGALPRPLGSLHPKFQSPATASTVLGALGTVLFVGFAVAKADPYIGLATALTGLFTLGIVAAQALVSIAVVVFYARSGTRPGWSTLGAPVLGGLGAIGACYAIVANYSVLTGSTSTASRLLPAVLLVAVPLGFAVQARRNAKSGA
ncbi:APC family permease [Nocardioides jejuensis]|nr:APC family permease [Nocardioides jejuensis]